MKKLILLLRCLCLIAIAENAEAATSLYWDIDGSTAGAGGGTTPNGNWEASSWSTSSAGTASTIAWAEGGFPRFAAGTTATGNYTVTANNNHTIAGMFGVGSGGSGQKVTIAGTGILTIDPTGGPQQGFFAQNGSWLVISNQIAGAGGIIASSGQLFLNGNNTYSGGTTPTALLNFSNPNSFGTGNLLISSSGGALIGEGTSAINIPNNWTVSVPANLNCVGNPAGITYSGNIALGANTLSLGCGGAANNLDVFSGIISGTGGVGRESQSPAGTIQFTGANTYTGKSSIQSGTTVVSSLNSVSAPTPQASSSLGVPASAAAGTLGLGATANSGTLVYTGAGETTDRVIDLAGTTGGATIENDGPGALIFTSPFTASGAGAKTLTLQGTSTAGDTISGAIVDSSSGATSLTKAQAGNWTLSGVNTFTGDMTISGGTLTIGGKLGNGDYAGNITNNGGSLVFNNSSGQTLSGVISGAGGTLTVLGKLSLTAAETYTGATTISGYLYLDGAGALPANSSVTLLNGAQLSVIGATSSPWTLGAGATFTAIGSPFSIIFGNGNVSFGSRPIIISFAPGSATGDMTSFALSCRDCTLALADNSFTVTNASASPLGAGTYSLIDVDYSISGSPSPFVSVRGAGLAAGMGASVVATSGTVDLVVQPAAAFSALTASQSISSGTPITLSGRLSGANQVYPAMIENVSVTINGLVQSTQFNDATGDFTIVFPTATFPVTGSPLTITYSYIGDASLSPALDSSTTLTVTKPPLTITANNQSKPYGQVVAFGAGSTLFTSSGLQPGDTIGTVTLAVSGSGGAAAAGVSGSPYTITPSAATGGTFNPANYSITYNNGSLTVTPAPLTVTGNNAAKFYGATNPLFTVAFSGFVNSQTLGTSDVGGSPSLTIAAVTNSPIGIYDITNGIGTLTSTNYSFASFVDGALTVNPLPVNLTGTRAFDGTNDADASILTITNNYDTTNLTLSGSALLADSGVGLQSITNFTGLALGGSAATNYTLLNASGSVLITQPPPSLTYATNNGTITVTGSSGVSGAVVIPDFVNGLPVTGIGVTAFQGNTAITSVVISTNVLNIADAAFYSCTALTSVFIPDSVTNLGNSAFAYCSALMSVTGGSNVMSMGQSVFNGCAALPGIILSTNLASAGSFTFFNCTALQSIVIPASLPQLGDYMFDGCTGLTNVVLTNTLSSIGNGTFGGCSSLTSLTIPNGVTSIGSAAFVACTALASVTIPNSVTNIGDTAFENCSSLTGVYFQGNAPGLGGANVFQGVNAAATAYYLGGTTGWGAPYYGGLPTVRFGGAYNQIASQVLGGGNVQLSFIGNYGINYALDRSSSLSPANWVPQVTNSTGPGGLLVFTNTPDATTNNFWRFRSVP